MEGFGTRPAFAAILHEVGKAILESSEDAEVSQGTNGGFGGESLTGSVFDERAFGGGHAQRISEEPTRRKLFFLFFSKRISAHFLLCA